MLNFKSIDEELFVSHIIFVIPVYSLRSCISKSRFFVSPYITKNLLSKYCVPSFSIFCCALMSQSTSYLNKLMLMMIVYT